MNQAEIIKAAQQGDTNCFEQLVLHFEAPLYRFLLIRCHNKSDAEDILQNAFINAFKYIKSYNKQWQFNTWLYSIAYKELAKYTSKQKNSIIDYDSYTFESSLSEYLSETTFGEKINQEIINKENIWSLAKQTLSTASFEVLWFFYIEGFDISSIAHIVEKNSNWVKVSLHRSRNTLYHSVSKSDDLKPINTATN